MNNKLIIGITGPMASGKNEVCEVFKKYGAFIIDADEIGHQAIKKNKIAWKKIVKAFGKDILYPNQNIDRKKLGRTVFNNKTNLKKLNAIVHPEILKEIKRKIIYSKKKIIAVNAAVLKEIGLNPYASKIIAVISSRKNRLNRIIKNKSISKKEAISRMNSQRSNSDYMKGADIVIRNDGSLLKLKDQVKKAIRKF